jgi:transposase
MVHRVMARSNRLGVAAVETPGKGGRHRHYLMWEEEQAFLTPFFARAERGEIATAGEIQRAFEAQVGHPVHTSTISRLLKRHGWRKPVPRPVHPKANAQAQEQFTKTLRPVWKPPSPRARPMTNARS